MVRVLAMVIGRDIAANEPRFAVVHRGIAVLEIHLRLPKRFHLGAAQHDASLVGLENLVVVEGLAVGCDDLVSSHGAPKPARPLTSRARSVSSGVVFGRKGGTWRPPVTS